LSFTLADNDLLNGVDGGGEDKLILKEIFLERTLDDKRDYKVKLYSHVINICIFIIYYFLSASHLLY